LEKIEKIEVHKNKRITCFFIEGEKAISIDYEGSELFFWDIKDIKNWRKVFSIEKKMSFIIDSNGEL
jgi:hypothetical protein